MTEKITPKYDPSEEAFCSVKDCVNDGAHKVFGEWYCYDHAFQNVSAPFDEFMMGVKELVEGKAKDKGYNDKGDGPENPLFEFTNDFFEGHSGGEVIYKMVRWSRKRNKEDLLKAAAWIYLMYRYDK